MSNLRRLVVGLSLLLPFVACEAQELKVRGDKQRVEGDGYWIYNDLPRGIEQAKESKKPLLVVFRCVPCEAECVWKLCRTISGAS